MSITLVATWGAATSNSYSTVADAATLISENSMGYKVWFDNPGEDQARALLIAANNIEGFNWFGARYYWDQILKFPRTPPGETSPIGVFGEVGSGNAYLSLLENDVYQTEMYKRVRLAQALQALYLMQKQQETDGGRDKHRDKQTQGISNWSRSVAGVSESYSYGRNKILCPEAWEQLYLYKAPQRFLRGDAITLDQDR